jgi:hypothetical protein
MLLEWDRSSRWKRASVHSETRDIGTGRSLDLVVFQFANQMLSRLRSFEMQFRLMIWTQVRNYNAIIVYNYSHLWLKFWLGLTNFHHQDQVWNSWESTGITTTWIRIGITMQSPCTTEVPITEVYFRLTAFRAEDQAWTTCVSTGITTMWIRIGIAMQVSCSSIVRKILPVLDILYRLLFCLHHRCWPTFRKFP